MHVAKASASSKFLTFAIVLFLVLDALMLGLNFSITRSVASDALIINLAGRQRMLSQRMTKAVFQIDMEQLKTSTNQQLLEEFVSVHRLFSQTLQGFERGGVVRDAELNQVSIRPIDIDEVQTAIAEANQLLEPITAEASLIAGSATPEVHLMALRGLLSERNGELLRLMNEITVYAEKSSRAQTERLRLIQLITFLLAMLNFAYIIKLFRDGVRQTAEIVDTLSELLQGTNAAMIVFDEAGHVSLLNRSAAELYGSDEETIKHQSYETLFEFKDAEVFAVSPDDKRLTPVEMHERVLSRDTRTMRVVTLVNISQYLEVQQNLKQAATIDPLTGLYNRAALNLDIVEKVEQSRIDETRFACVFVDLDGFKGINDNLGHDAGDQLLTAIARRLKGVLRESDRAYRFGGDEFIVLVDLREQSPEIDLILARIKSISERPYHLDDDLEVRLGLSAGAAIYPDDATTVEELLGLSDRLMYEEKRQSREESA